MKIIMLFLHVNPLINNYDKLCLLAIAECVNVLKRSDKIREDDYEMCIGDIIKYVKLFIKNKTKVSY